LRFFLCRPRNLVENDSCSWQTTKTPYQDFSTEIRTPEQPLPVA
jgi:hypothetical protein